MRNKIFSLLAPLCAVPFCLSQADAAVAIGAPSLIDVADGKLTFGDVAFSAPTSRGNDGIAAEGNWTHADFPTSATPYPGEAVNAPNPYWEVDLSGNFDLQSVVITDRIGTCCDPNRLNGSTVTFYGAGGSTIGTAPISIADGTFGSIITLDNGGAGYAGVERIRIDGTNQYFQFSEIDALSLVAAPINWALGTTVGYFNGGGAPVNTYPGQPAANVTDGILSSIVHSNDQSADGYYAQVDLGQEIMIDNISLTGRTDGCCPERLENYTLEFRDAAGNLVHTMSNAGQTTSSQIFDVIGDFGGNGPAAQFVRVINSGNNPYGPQIGELEVFGVIPEPSSSLLILASSLFLLRRRR